MPEANKRLVRLQRKDGRFVFAYIVRDGDTASQIAEDLLGNVRNVDVIKMLNPNIVPLSDIQACRELIVAVATPNQINVFLEQAFDKVSESSELGDIVKLPNFNDIVKSILEETYEGPLP